MHLMHLKHLMHLMHLNSEILGLNHSLCTTLVEGNYRGEGILFCKDEHSFLRNTKGTCVLNMLCCYIVQFEIISLPRYDIPMSNRLSIQVNLPPNLLA